MMTNQSIRSLKLGGILLALACMGSAQAQQVGSYVGTTADGHEVTIDVALDDTTGQYVISGVSGGFTMHCPKTGTSLEWGLGAYGFNPPVDAGHADFLVRDDIFYLAASLDFKSDDKITGKIRGASPAFADDKSPPKAGQACNADNLKFTATFSSSEARGQTVAAPRQVTARIDRQGRRVIQHSRIR